MAQEADSRPKIFVLDGSLDVTGAFISAREMARAMRKQADVVLLIPKTSRIASDALTDFSAVHRLPIRNLGSGLVKLAP